MNHSYKFRCVNSLVCKNCMMIPLITLIDSSPIKLQYRCKCSSQISLLKDYIKNIHSNSTYQPIRNRYCQSILSHYNKTASGYCICCQEFLCKQCIEKHKLFFSDDHQIRKEKIKGLSQCYHLWNDDHFFCVNCFAIYCPECNSSHNNHYSIQPQIIKVQTMKRTIINVQKLYKSLLEKTFIQAKSQDETLKQSYKECLRKNNLIISLLKILLLNYKLDNDPFSFCLNSNVYRHTKFNLTPSNYKSFPQLNTVSDYITFFNSFQVISNVEHENIPEETMKLKIVVNIDIPHIYVTTILSFIHANFFILGDAKGTLMSYVFHKSSLNCYPNYFYYNAHMDEINLLKYIEYKTFFISCSKDKTIKIWKIVFESTQCWFELISHYKAHRSTPIQAVYLPNDIIISITEKGKIKVWNM